MKPQYKYLTKELIQDLVSFVKPYKIKFILGSLARATSDLVWLFPAWAIAEIITFTANYKVGEDTAYVWNLLLVIFLFSIYHVLFHQVSKYFLYQVAENAKLDSCKKTLKHLYKIDLKWHEKENSGNKMQRIIKGSSSLETIIRMYVDLVIESTINLVAILIILTTLDSLFAFILVFFFISYFLLSYQLTKKAVNQSHIVNVEWESFTGLAFESINNIFSIKALRIGTKIFPFIETVSRNLVGSIRKRIYYFRWRAGILTFYHEFFKLIILSFTLWQIFEGNLEVGILAMVLLYFNKIEESAYEFAEVYSQFVTAKIAILRMKEILAIEPVIENEGKLDFKESWQKLSLKNVSFSYQNQNVLEDFSLTINRGEKVGIVGISGSGKSTLFKLLLKLYGDYQGEIKFDDTSLQDIKRESYLQHISVVPQETELFNLSLEKNITIDREQKDSELLEQALQVACINDFSDKLPEGLQSLVGEKGIKLSGGERQRVGIARAIYQSSEILLMDEATSHLDINSEKKIQAGLATFLEDITAIVIAHRLSTIKSMDKIVVMNQGRVVEIGNFDELISKNGIFAELWKQDKT